MEYVILGGYSRNEVILYLYLPFSYDSVASCGVKLKEKLCVVADGIHQLREHRARLVRWVITALFLNCSKKFSMFFVIGYITLTCGVVNFLKYLSFGILVVILFCFFRNMSAQFILEILRSIKGIVWMLVEWLPRLRTTNMIG